MNAENKRLVANVQVNVDSGNILRQIREINKI